MPIKKLTVFCTSFGYWFRCGTHSAAQGIESNIFFNAVSFSCAINNLNLLSPGYTIEQDLTKDYPECCAYLKRVQRKFKQDVIDASAVKINKFKGRLGGKRVESNTPKDIESIVSSTISPSVIVNENIEEKDLALEQEETTNWISRLN